MSIKQPSWFQHAVMYQIYPRSFQDSNGDGIGDLNGITSRLDYLKDTLGVDGLWLSPFYKSPMVDFGYDIADCCAVDPIFGTLEDFDRLLDEAHRRDIKIIIDYVPNHTSDQHNWFQESRQGRDNPKRDWYIWRDAKPDGSPPNNWLGVLGGLAWDWDETTGQYYLHSFSPEQPDLNWENPDVQQAMADVLRFWLDRGVDGFRMDAVNWLGKDPTFPDEPRHPAHQAGDDPYKSLKHIYSLDVGNIMSYLHSLMDVVAKYPDRLVVLETWFYKNQPTTEYFNYYQQLNRPFCAPINLEFLFMDWSAKEFQKFINTFHAGLRPYDIPVHVLSNHDLPRFASKVGPHAARAGVVMLLTLPGVAFIYNGDELGMENVPIAPEKMLDPHGNKAPEYCRDPYRTPMQWSAAEHAGFSTVEPWLPVSDKYRLVNVEKQVQDSTSMLALYQQLIRLRNSSPILAQGDYRPGPQIHPDVVSYHRILGEERWLVLLNFSNKTIPLRDIPAGASLVLSSNDATENQTAKLKPHEARILAIKSAH